jgi:hypothetical protein
VGATDEEEEEDEDEGEDEEGEVEVEVEVEVEDKEVQGGEDNKVGGDNEWLEEVVGVAVEAEGAEGVEEEVGLHGMCCKIFLISPGWWALWVVSVAEVDVGEEIDVDVNVGVEVEVEVEVEVDCGVGMGGSENGGSEAGERGLFGWLELSEGEEINGEVGSGEERGREEVLVVAGVSEKERELGREIVALGERGRVGEGGGESSAIMSADGGSAGGWEGGREGVERFDGGVVGVAELGVELGVLDFWRFAMGSTSASVIVPSGLTVTLSAVYIVDIALNFSSYTRFLYGAPISQTGQFQICCWYE